jgi:hypothetical protein
LTAVVQEGSSHSSWNKLLHRFYWFLFVAKGNTATVAGKQIRKSIVRLLGMFLVTTPYSMDSRDVLRSIVRKQNIQNGEQCTKHFGHIRLEKEEETSYSQLYTAFSTKEKESSIIGVMLMFLYAK